ncbi:TonB-dependent receptor [Pseudoalteromonas sp. NBT06-2]|uniref:TonB-dependent receptor n=1 Tax=Pseudoalteromonas sp. NBT06-2 TaxID=2025950 RepID=UPI000BA7CFDE|nr:TonB-dependent receptor [Pseudoalteromonas sp. NBT06-2]PAJ72140.1 TonB-dependent receptor [Pseudoalteromonas sp. NBT06-2]
MFSHQKKLLKTHIKFLWRKIFNHSSLFLVWRKTIQGEYQRLQNRLFCLMMIISLNGNVIATEKRDKVIFNIPRQRADLSLINFAEQADVTLLFPMDKVQGKQTNSVIGEYSIMNALVKLLKNSGLKTKIDESGQLSILIDPSFERNKNMVDYNKNKVASAVLAVLGTVAVSQPVLAEETKKAKEVEVIQVTGIRGSLARAMDVKRDASGVVDSISAEDIGKFPDTNLAESLQRISGVSIDRSGGEGQMITVRGFGPQFNTVLVNGRKIASENASRAFSFDTIASEMVKSLDVHKTSSATVQSGGVGSTVNINTARPFAIDGFKVAGSVKAVVDGNSEKTTPQVSALISNTFNDDTLGVLLALSYQERETRLNQAQTDGWLENVGIPDPKTQSGENYSGNIFSARNYDHKVTFENRTRTNANLVLQYAPLDNLIVTADVLYSDFDIETNATSYGHWFTAPNVENAVVDENGTVIDMYQEIGLATDFHAKKFDRLTSSSSFGLNFNWDINDNLNMQFDLSTSKATRDENNGRGDQLSLIGYANRVRFEIDNNILPLSSNFTSADSSIYSGQQELDGVAYDPTVSPAGVSDFYDTTNSKAHVMLRRGWAVEDDLTQLRWNAIWSTDGDTGLTAVKFGAMYSSETKSLDRWDNEGAGIHCTYCGYPDTPDMSGFEQYIFDAGSDFLSDVSGSGRMPTSWLAHDGEANFAYLEQYYASVNSGTISFDAAKRDNSFEISEDIYSFYLELDFEGELAGMLISSTAGFRYESTSTDVQGTTAPVTALTILDKTEMLAQFGSPELFTQSTSYDEILPNFSVKLEMTDDLIARVAASKTLTRPTLSSMSPVTVITTTRQGGNLNSASGNPALVPFSSDNLDLSLEWYYDEASYLSAGYFRKHVANFIVNSQEPKTFELQSGGLLTDPSTGSTPDAPDADDEVAVFTNTLPNNGESAIVDGWEIAAQHTFNSGFGLLANVTLVNSNAELDPRDITQVFALTGLSDSLNLVTFYENGPFQGRIAYNWRDSFLQSLSQNNGDGVTIVEEYYQIDASASYDVTENLTVFVEGINLTEEYIHKRGRFTNQLLLIEDSGRRFGIGIRSSF